MKLAIVVDLGSSYLKGAKIGEDAELFDLVTLKAPRLKGSGLIREGDPVEYLKKASKLKDKLLKSFH